MNEEAATNWRSYRNAPTPGTVLCPLSLLQDPGAVCLDLDGFPLLLVRRDGVVRGFVNACPHQFLPLNHRGDKVMSADGMRLICSNHGAAFDALTGIGQDGLGSDCTLDRVPVTIGPGGIIVVGAPDSVENLDKEPSFSTRCV